jgi:propionyl-CoA synthetase
MRMATQAAVATRPSTYADVYARWRAAPEAFWADAAEAVHWFRRWDAVLDASRAPFYRWFPGGHVNTCYNAVDRHVENGRADQPALIYDSPVTGTVRTFTFRELRDEVALVAGMLSARGVAAGDRVIIYMPMVPEAVFAMLACARIGAIHSVVFGGFASHELASRITDARPNGRRSRRRWCQAAITTGPSSWRARVQ